MAKPTQRPRGHIGLRSDMPSTRIAQRVGAKPATVKNIKSPAVRPPRTHGRKQ